MSAGTNFSSKSSLRPTQGGFRFFCRKKVGAGLFLEVFSPAVENTGERCCIVWCKYLTETT